MKREIYTALSGAFLMMFLASRAFDLNIGWFGIGVLIISIAFGVAAIVSVKSKDSASG